MKHFHPILELTNDLNGLNVLNVLNVLNLNSVMIVEMVMIVIKQLCLIAEIDQRS